MSARYLHTSYHFIDRPHCMPELPEVETTKRGIAPFLEGAKIKRLTVRDHRLRWPVTEGIERLAKHRIVDSVSRRGKYLLIQLDKGVMIVHLGMSGSLRVIQDAEPPAKHDHVELLTVSGDVVRFNDPRRFGAWLWVDEKPLEHELLAHLGPEPLSEHFNADVLFHKSRKRRVAVKNFIMNSQVVVGVGNIYANEALFKAGIHPQREASRISKKRYAVLVDEIKATLAYAIERGGTTLRDFVGGDGKPGYFQQELLVYGRSGEACKVCKHTLTEVRIGQRSTVYCKRCQS